MSLRHNVPEMIAENLPGKRVRIDDTGLRKRPQMEQIVNYLESGQERVNFPDREAKFIRNHPFMTHLDFFDMQEDQERAWEQQKKEQEAQRISKETRQTAAEVRAEGTQTDKPRTFSRATETGTQYFDISGEYDKMTSDERMRQEQNKENVRRKVEHNLGENPGTIPFIETRASSSQGYSSMYVQGPKVMPEPRFEQNLKSEQGYTSQTTQGPRVEQNLKSEQGYTSQTTEGPRFSVRQNLKSEQGYTSQTTQGPRVEQNLKSKQYYTSETSQGPQFSVRQNLKSEQGYTSSTTSKRRVAPRIRLRKKTGEDTYMPDSSAGQQAPKRSASAHPEDPESKKTTANAPKMDQPSASSSSGPDPAASSSSGPVPAASSASAAKKGDKKDTVKKSQVKKETVKQPIPPRPAHATEVDKSNDLKHWERQNKGKLVDQITKRGYRGDLKTLSKMKNKELAALIVTLPVPT
jgi:hypothetical protein